MIRSNLKTSIFLNLTMALLIILLLIDYVGTFGWGIFQYFMVFLATKDVVKAVQLIELYWHIHQKKKDNK